jgi:hyperosmotically inducible protein
MGRYRGAVLTLACLAAWVSLGCRRASESAAPAPVTRDESTVGDDVKDVAKATEKAAKDLGRATADFAGKAGGDLEHASNKAGVDGQDAWITTKVKSALTSEGFDPLHVHVDTDGKVVTLSGTIASASQAQRAVSLAKAVSGVLGVKDHLFVGPAQR